MLNTTIIFEELKDTMSEPAALKIANVLARVYQELLNTVTKTEFNEFKTEFNELTATVKELAEAQKRTEVRVEELAEAQKRTEIKMDQGFEYLKNQISALGSRWGIYNEGTFRATIQGV
ncbi:MAG: DUF3782 domain-containing protein, partial [Desulfobacterales bacterium]|nr:DUF3782 domain-containing protein [Desulfobacterales bacterium]